MADLIDPRDSDFFSGQINYGDLDEQDTSNDLPRSDPEAVKHVEAREINILAQDIGALKIAIGGGNQFQAYKSWSAARNLNVRGGYVRRNATTTTVAGLTEYVLPLSSTRYVYLTIDATPALGVAASVPAGAVGLWSVTTDGSGIVEDGDGEPVITDIRPFAIFNDSLAGAVLKTDYNAQTILHAVLDDTPLPLTVGNSTLVGRTATGDVDALEVTEVHTLLNIENGADVTDATNVNAAGAVMEIDYDAHTILRAIADNTPLPLTVPEQTVVGRITAGNIQALDVTALRTLINVENGADVTDTANVTSAGALMKTTYYANTILKADSDDTPVALTVPASRIVGRVAAGVINALTGAEVRGIINVEDGADVTDAANVNAAGAVMESDYGANSLLAATTASTPTTRTIAEGEIVGRKSGGAIEGLTAAEVQVILACLLADGSIPMTGDLDMDGNDIDNIAQVTGVGGAAIEHNADLDLLNHDIQNLSTISGVGSAAVDFNADMDMSYAYGGVIFGHADAFEINIAGSGAPNILTLGEGSKILSNEGTPAKNYHTLPTAAPMGVNWEGRMRFTFIVQDANGIRVNASAGDTIRFGASVSSAGGYIESTTVGDTLVLQNINNTEWVAICPVGTWSVA